MLLKKSLIAAILTFSVSLLYAQSLLPDSMKVGDMLEIYGKDSIRMNFDCSGTMKNKDCSYYYRKGKIDPVNANVTGTFTDYYKDGEVFLTCTLINNKLEGPAVYYYRDGIRKDEGAYKNNLRTGKWNFNYPDGNKKKVYNYTDSGLFVSEAYASNGDTIVFNGKGHLRTDFIDPFSCNKYQAEGNIENGRQQGKWQYYYAGSTISIATEYFIDGSFIRGGNSYIEYRDKPKIILNDFSPSERINTVEAVAFCKSYVLNIFQYKTDDIHVSFYPELQAELKKYNFPMKNQWLAVGITVNKRVRLDGVSVFSSINDTNLENYIYRTISNMVLWTSQGFNNSKAELNLFFSIIVADGQAIIPIDYFYGKKTY